MRNPKPIDYLLLGTLSLIWASAFFNIKIATYSFGPVTIAFFRIFLGAIPVVLLCLVAGDKRCSLNKIKKLLNEKDVSMANADQVKEITGFTIGGVSPVGHLNKIDIFIDESLERFENVFAAAGHPHSIFKINFVNLCKITNGLVKNISE